MIRATKRAKSIFLEAIELTPDERQAYVDAATGEDQNLRQQVQSLLEHAECMGDFLDHDDPADTHAASAMDRRVTDVIGTTIGPYKIREVEPRRPSVAVSTLHGEKRTTIANQRRLEKRRLDESLRGELDWIVMKALEKDRARRYDSASALADDVQRYLDGDLVQACPPSAAYRFRKLVRRNRVLLATTAAVTLALITGTGVSLWQAFDARQARDLADRRLTAEQAARKAADTNLLLANEATAREQAERERAEENYQLARGAVDRYFVKVSQDKLLNAPSMQPLSKELLELALEYYQGFLDQQPDDPEVRAELAEAYQRVAIIRGQIGSVQESLPAFEEALKIYDQLALEAPANVELRSDLVETRILFANARLSTGGTIREGMNLHLATVSDCEKLVELHADSLDFKNLLAASLNNVAVTLHQLGEIPRSMDYQERSVVVMESIVKQQPEPAYEVPLANFLTNLAAQQNKTGKFERAIPNLRRAISIRKRLLGKSQKNSSPVASSLPEYLVRRIQSELADSYMKLGRSLRGVGGVANNQKALALNLEAISIQKSLVDENPEFHLYGYRLAEAYRKAAEIYVQNENQEAAAEFFDEAITILQELLDENPEVRNYRKALTWAFNRLAGWQAIEDRHQDALGNFRRAVGLWESPKIRLTSMSELTVAAEGYYGLGLAYNRSGDEAAAADAWNHLIALTERDVPNPFYRTYLGLAHYRLGDWEKSRMCLEQAISAGGDDGPTAGPLRWWFLTMTLHRLGEVERAREYFEVLNAQFIQSGLGDKRWGHKSARREAAKVLGIKLEEDAQNAEKDAAGV